ncbi:phage minor capsid protein, partial [Pseudoruminococcus massiliensis]|uniref:phage minor capsid protein n=1 Tax=Pseudoruminococcus massiliensis TaxID=2086583 RepID=UPI003AB2B4E9
MTNSGLRTVDYETGWSNRTDVAARRAVMTGLTQVTAKVNENNAEKLGTDMFEVSWHSGARPSHQVWQGRWYKSSELESVCGLGSVTGLCGANCYHSYYPVVPGISVPTYTEEELDEMNRQENIPIDYNGKQYTKYEALQRQRQLETR